MSQMYKNGLSVLIFCLDDWIAQKKLQGLKNPTSDKWSYEINLQCLFRKPFFTLDSCTLYSLDVFIDVNARLQFDLSMV